MVEFTFMAVILNLLVPNLRFSIVFFFIPRWYQSSLYFLAWIYHFSFSGCSWWIKRDIHVCKVYIIIVMWILRKLSKFNFNVKIGTVLTSFDNIETLLEFAKSVLITLRYFFEMQLSWLPRLVVSDLQFCSIMNECLIQFWISCAIHHLFFMKSR